jgi:hypothetical protein
MPVSKGAFSILHGISAALIVGFLAVTGSVLLQSRALNREGRAYADAAARAILNGWNEQALTARASTQLRSAVESGAHLKVLFTGWRRLGEFRKWDGCQGNAAVDLTPDARAVVTSTCVGTAEFAHGTAQVRISLIQQHGAWRILGFGVYPNEPAAHETAHAAAPGSSEAAAATREAREALNTL